MRRIFKYSLVEWKDGSVHVGGSWLQKKLTKFKQLEQVCMRMSPQTMQLPDARSWYFTASPQLLSASGNNSDLGNYLEQVESLLAINHIQKIHSCYACASAANNIARSALRILRENRGIACEYVYGRWSADMPSDAEFPNVLFMQRTCMFQWESCVDI